MCHLLHAVHAVINPTCYPSGHFHFSLHAGPQGQPTAPILMNYAVRLCGGGNDCYIEGGQKTYNRNEGFAQWKQGQREKEKSNVVFYKLKATIGKLKITSCVAPRV